MNKQEEDKINERILTARADLLAREFSGQPVSEMQDTREMLVFVLAGEAYALDLEFISESIDLQNITRIPSTPAFLTGLTNIRGRIIPVLDLKQFFHLKQTGISASTKIIVLSHGKREIAIQADAIMDTQWIDAASIGSMPYADQGIASEFVEGITRQALIILHGERLLEGLTRQLTKTNQQNQ